MNRKFVVLHSDPSAAAHPTAKIRGLPTPAPLIEVVTLSTQDAAARASASTVVAPVMPMKLITPTSVREAPPAPPGNVAWGVTAVGALNADFDGEGIVVAVLDTGINRGHPAFSGMEFSRRNFTTEADDDLHGHGTHCAGTIFGKDVEGFRIGVARGVQKALIGKVLGAGGGSSDQIVEAIQWALSEGASVISMSLGIDFPGYVHTLQTNGVPVEVATSMALEGYRANVQLFERLASFIAAQELFGRSTLLVAAAGNESRKDLDADFRIAVSPPAVANGFLSVAALQLTAAGLVPASFSNVGALVAAPGVDIVSARHTGGLVAMSGTSMATPHVAGVAARWAQRQLPVRSTAQLNSRVMASATMKGMAPQVDVRDVGAGIVQSPP